MALSVTGRTGEVLVAESVHPEYRQMLATYLANLNCRVRDAADARRVPRPRRREEGGRRPDRRASSSQRPNFFGHLEEMRGHRRRGRARPGALVVVSFDPISLGLLKRPGDYGADIAVAEGQCLGNPLATAGRTSASWPAARSSSARCPAGSSARRPTATASAAGC